MKPLDAGLRTGVIAGLVLRKADKSLGRTTLMKMCYFLQELKGVPLGYDFRLFTYGPYDSDVMGDLSQARDAGAVAEKLVTYGRGYGYDITPGSRAERWHQRLADTLPAVAQAVADVASEFGHYNAGELELRSTILFVDREFHRDGTEATLETVAQRVHDVKPHFTLDTIKEAMRGMNHHLRTAVELAGVEDSIPF